jgi:transcriptional regulator with XRE-family HTH domain
MLGQRLRQLRKGNSLTLQQVADELGVTRACVSKWETGTSSPDLARLGRLAAIFGFGASDLLAEDPADDAPTQHHSSDFPVLTLENGTPIAALLDRHRARRHPSPHPLPPGAFFVALGDYMAAHFGLDRVPRDALLLVDPHAPPHSGDLVLAQTKQLGYQVLAVREGPTQLEYLSLGIKLVHLGPLEDVTVHGVVIEAVSAINLRGYALRQSPQLLFA